MVAMSTTCCNCYNGIIMIFLRRVTPVVIFIRALEGGAFPTLSHRPKSAVSRPASAFEAPSFEVQEPKTPNPSKDLMSSFLRATFEAQERH